MLKILTAISTLVIPTTAFAQGLPSWSIELYCANRAKSSGMAMNDLFPACIEAERASLAELKEAWTDYSAASREKCLKTVANDQHYADLQACIVAAEASRHSEKK